jgi:hypothetical protein
MAQRPDSLRYKRSDTLDRLPCLWHYRGEQMPAVRHARPYFELDPTSCSAHAIGHAHRVVAQDLITSHLKDGRWETRGFAVEW